MVFLPPSLISYNSDIATQIANSSGVEIKTQSKTVNQSLTATRAVDFAKRNPLSAYRSYTYRFTLAALKNQELIDPSQYVENRDYFVIARSGGKGSAGLDIELVTTPDTGTALNRLKREVFDPIANIGIQASKQRFEDFNQNSAGAFDHYITRVQLKNILGGSERSNMSIVTNIEIDLLETLSMAGFIEALHVTALACGAPNYTQCKYILKMEFIGYPDSDDTSPPEIVADSTRFFVFGFTGIEVDVTEAGTVYRCTGVPHNELGFGNPSELTTDIEAEGTTVEEILKSFIENLNISNAEAAKQENSNQNGSLAHEYEIVFPKTTNQGVDEAFRSNPNYQLNEIATSKVLEIFKSNSVYKFPEPADVTQDNQLTDIVSQKLDPSNPVVPFKRGATVLDCVTAVIRDSEYTANIVKDLRNKIDDASMVDYFMVHLEAEVKGYDDTKNQYAYRYRFIVTKFKVHYSRIYPRPDGPIETKIVRENAHREYEYFYTGANTDILRFYLKFNTLFFQAIPHNMGNNPQSTDAAESAQPSNSNDAVLKRSVFLSKAASFLTSTPIKSTASASKPSPDGNENAISPQAETYTQLARRMHKAILENVDQVTADIEILGDPYFLVTTGLGVQRFKLNANGTSGLNEAPIYTNDVMIYIKFINPYDIDQNTGLLKFKNPVAPWSGVFRVIEVESKFIDGEFRQNLSLIRLGSQVEDFTDQVPAPIENLFDSRANPSKQAVAAPPAVPSSSRANSQQLAAEISAGLPVAGLPGDLSYLIPTNVSSAGQPLQSGSIVSPQINATSAAATSVGSLINQISATAQQSLNNISSTLRLTNAGLTALSPSINQIGGTVDQISRTINSVGFSNLNNLNVAATLQAASQQLVPQLSGAAIDKVNSLGNAASGLVSEVSSRLDNLAGASAALSSRLGVDVSALSGISGNLPGKLSQKITEAAASIPENVDLTAAVDRGLILDNIPLSSLPNIPATHPRARAPQPRLPIAELRSLQQQLTPASQLPAQQATRSQIPVSPFDAAAVAGKLATIDRTVARVLGKTPSVEATLNTVQARISSGVPNTANVATSVVNRYAAQEVRISPLANLINNGDTN